MMKECDGDEEEMHRYTSAVVDVPPPPALFGDLQPLAYLEGLGLGHQRRESRALRSIVE